MTRLLDEVSRKVFPVQMYLTQDSLRKFPQGPVNQDTDVGSASFLAATHCTPCHWHTQGSPLSIVFQLWHFPSQDKQCTIPALPESPPLLMLLLAQVWPAWMMQGWPLQEQNMQKPSLSVREWTYTDRSSIHYSLETVRWMRVPSSVYPWHRASHFHTFVSSDTCPTLFRPLMFMHKMSQHEFYIQLRTWGPVLSEVWNKHK